MCRLLRQKHKMIVPHETVRMLLKQMDPVSVNNRRHHRLQRRTYSSRGPNDTWHIDGYDKLRPYGILINGYVVHVFLFVVCNSLNLIFSCIKVGPWDFLLRFCTSFHKGRWHSDTNFLGRSSRKKSDKTAASIQLCSAAADLCSKNWRC